ncbi:MAG: MerR family transcriptional regulator [Candidatus Methylomirabilales bacterium]
MGQPLFIGKVAKQLGLSPRTIRYYESLGWLRPKPPWRTPVLP